jgi:hypothetical protein
VVAGNEERGPINSDGNPKACPDGVRLEGVRFEGEASEVNWMSPVCCRLGA